MGGEEDIKDRRLDCEFDIIGVVQGYTVCYGKGPAGFEVAF